MTDPSTFIEAATAANAAAGQAIVTAAERVAASGRTVVPVPGVPLPFRRRLRDAMYASLMTSLRRDGRALCEHLDVNTPTVSIWLAASPARLLCRLCAALVEMDADAPPRCALCGSGRRLFEGSHRLRAKVILDGDRVPGTLGAVVVRWVVCQGCLGEGDDAA